MSNVWPLLIPGATPAETHATILAPFDRRPICVSDPRLALAKGTSLDTMQRLNLLARLVAAGPAPTTPA